VAQGGGAENAMRCGDGNGGGGTTTERSNRNGVIIGCNALHPHNAGARKQYKKQP